MAKIALLLLLLVLPARAEPLEAERQSAAPNCSPLSLAAARLEARKLLDDAEQMREWRSKVRSLEAAYRLYQTPVILYNLGMLWYGAGRRVEGADLLRRYLYEADRAVAPERRDRLSRLLARVGHGTGELELSSEPCAFVYVDGRLVGRTPLSLPLLLKTGTRTVEVEKGPRRQRLELLVAAGQRNLTVRLPASAVLVTDGVAEAVSAAAEGAIAEAGLTPISAKARAAVLAGAPELRGCLQTLPCQQQLARLLAAQYVLQLSAHPDGRLVLQLLDADADAVSAAREEDCGGCAPEQLAQRTLEVARAVLREGLGRGKGTLQVTSTPEADVVIDGRRVGRTPLLRAALSGTHTVALHAEGYLPYQVRVELEDGRKTAVDAVLSVATAPPVAAPPAPPPAPVRNRPQQAQRPRWRLALGGTVLGLGGGLLTLGALALGIHGQCGPANVPPMPMPGTTCERVYDTLGPGGAMLGTGAALLLAGVLAVAWPPSAEKE